MDKSVNYSLKIKNLFSKELNKFKQQVSIAQTASKKFNQKLNKLKTVSEKMKKGFLGLTKEYGKFINKSRLSQIVLKKMSDRFKTLKQNIKGSVEQVKNFKVSGSLGGSSKKNQTGKVPYTKPDDEKSKKGAKGFFGVYGSKLLGGLAVAAAGTYTIRTFADFEEALIGVSKTADIDAGPALEKMSSDLKESARSLTVNATVLANYAKIAAQLGVKDPKKLVNFAKTIAMVIANTDGLTGEGASINLARLINVSKDDIANIDRVSSALIALGNNSKATEDEILYLATMLASRTQAQSTTSSQALGMAAAAKGMGTQSEIFASGLARIYSKFEQVLTDNTGDMVDSVKILQSISGKSREQLLNDFRKNAIDTTIDIASKTNALVEKTMSLPPEQQVSFTSVLRNLGLSGIGEDTVFKNLGRQGDQIKYYMAMAEEEYEKNIANIEEYEKKAQTMTSLFLKFMGTLQTFLIEAIGGGEFIKSILIKAESILNKVTGVLKKFNSITNRTISGTYDTELFFRNIKGNLENIKGNLENVKNNFKNNMINNIERLKSNDYVDFLAGKSYYSKDSKSDQQNELTVSGKIEIESSPDIKVKQYDINFMKGFNMFGYGHKNE